MNKFLLTISLLTNLMARLSGQADGKMEYKFTEGEEFYYKMALGTGEELGHSYTHWLQINVISDIDDEYLMSMRYARILEELGGMVYDSNHYYTDIAFNFLHTVNQIVIDKPIYFKLSKEGKVSDLYFSQELNEAIKKNILGIRNKNNLKKISLLSQQRLKATIRSLFPLLSPGRKAKNWSEMIPSAMVKPGVTMEYTWEETTADAYVISTKQNFEGLDTAFFSQNEHIQFKPEKIWTNGRITLEKQDGKLRYSESKSGYRVIRKLVNNGSQTITIDNESTLTVENLANLRFGQRTQVKGTLREGSSLTEMRIYVWDDFPDRNVLDLSMEPENGKFSFDFQLERPTEVAVVGRTYNGFFANFGNILLEPGDNLTIDLSQAQSMSFEGKGARKNSLWQQMRDLGLSSSPNMKMGEVRRINQRNIRERTALLEAAKNDLSDWVYTHLQADIYYREQRSLYNYYVGNTERKADPELFDRIFRDLDFEKHPTSRSFEFRRFAYDYLKVNAQMYFGHEVGTLIPPSELYGLAAMLLDDEQEYFMKALVVQDALKLGKPQDYEPIYTDYINTYYGSPLIKTIKAAYDKRGNVALGQTAPDFRLKGLDRKDFQLSKSRGKWVMLVFYNLDDDPVDDYIKNFSQLSEQLPEEHFELVVAFTNRETERTYDYVNQNNFKATYLDNHGWKAPSTAPYNFPYLANNFLINPDGEFEFMGGVSSWDLYIKDFVEYIENDMAERAVVKGESEQTLIIWVLLAALIVIGFVWGYFVLRTARLKKREQEKVEKVELEIKAVRSQLNPHFIFNSMSSIQHLVNSRDHEGANLFLSKFATLMRKVLNQSDEHLLSLAQELETLTDYLDLEALRHGFAFELNIAETVDVHNIDIPPMLLQPFVENAVVHGIGQLKEQGKIVIDISQNSNDAISIKIIDNGLGLNQSVKATQSNGKGLDLTRRRLALIMEKFKNEISFALGDRQDFDGQRGAFAEIIVGLEN